MRFAIPADDRSSLFVGQALDALLGLEVELAPHALALVVDQRIGVAAVAVHVPVAGGYAAIGKENRHLMQRFRAKRPEIPLHVHVAHVGFGIALLGMNELGELVRIAHEEDRRVVADQIPVAFLGVELDRKAANIAFSVGRAALAS